MPIKDAYLMKIDGVWGAYIPRKKCSIVVNATPETSLIDFSLSLKEDFPDFRQRCVVNSGIAEKIRSHRGKENAGSRIEGNGKTEVRNMDAGYGVLPPRVGVQQR